jgi:hypothetical protein
MKDFKLKASNIDHGALVATTFFSSEVKARIGDFNTRVASLFESYGEAIKRRYEEMILKVDKFNRNSLHYAAMSAFTKSFKTVEQFLDV